MNENNLVERLAELEHDQWEAWSKNIAETESISFERFKRWAILWGPYSELTETEKDQDREWAKKVLEIFQSELKSLKKEVKGTRMTDEQRKGDTPERMAAQLYFNLALDKVLDLIDARLK